MLDLTDAREMGKDYLKLFRNNVLVIDNNKTDRVELIVRIVNALKSK